MRKIKFRAWDGEKMLSLSEANDNDLIVIQSGSDVICNDLETLHEDVKLMQYTGLKDKKGVEMYEGDIIKTTAMYAGNYGFKEIYEIKYVGNAFVGVGKEKDYEFQLVGSFAELHQLEVIGNIYENPELSKELNE